MGDFSNRQASLPLACCSNREYPGTAQTVGLGALDSLEYPILTAFSSNGSAPMTEVATEPTPSPMKALYRAFPPHINRCSHSLQSTVHAAIEIRIRCGIWCAHALARLVALGQIQLLFRWNGHPDHSNVTIESCYSVRALKP
jgi:hypothetical protein